jgi:hypothetical protein
MVKCVSSCLQWRIEITYLALCEDSSYAVEEVEGRDDVALDHDAAHDCRCRPPACHGRHFPKPLLQREAIGHSALSEHVCHDVEGDGAIWLLDDGLDGLIKRISRRV